MRSSKCPRARNESCLITQNSLNYEAPNLPKNFLGNFRLDSIITLPFQSGQRYKCADPLEMHYALCTMHYSISDRTLAVKSRKTAEKITFFS